MCTAIVVTSGKGGVGKTTVAANVGCALAQYKNRVALVDTDFGLRNLDVMLGLEERIVFDIADVIAGVCETRQALVAFPAVAGLSLLPAVQTRDKDTVTPQQMKTVIASLRPDFDYIIIDCPAGIENGFRNAVAGADHAIVVTNPEVSAVKDADRVIGLLDAYDLSAPKLIVNKIRPGMVRRGDMMDIDDIADVLGISLLGVIPDDERVIKAGNLGIPAVLHDGAASVAYRNIAQRVMGQDVPFLPTKRKYWHFWRVTGRASV